jgi:hypothetical protein
VLASARGRCTRAASGRRRARSVRGAAVVLVVFHWGPRVRVPRVGWETTRRVEEALETPQAATSKVARIGNGGIRSESSGLERTRRVRGQLVRDARELPAPTVGQGREPLHKLWLSLSLLKARAVSQEVARSSRAPPILLLARSESATNPDECLRLWQAATARP